jgi:hypothetical protein
MKRNSSPQLTAARALVELLANRPELETIVWTVGEQPGVLIGHHVGGDGTGELVDAVAAVTGGTVVRSTATLAGNRQGAAHLVATYRDVPVKVWASYPLSDARGLTVNDYRELLASRPLGTLLCLPGGAGASAGVTIPQRDSRAGDHA